MQLQIISTFYKEIQSNLNEVYNSCQESLRAFFWCTISFENVLIVDNLNDTKNLHLKEKNNSFLR